MQILRIVCKLLHIKGDYSGSCWNYSDSRAENLDGRGDNSDRVISIINSVVYLNI